MLAILPISLVLVCRLGPCSQSQYYSLTALQLCGVFRASRDLGLCLILKWGKRERKLGVFFFFFFFNLTAAIYFLLCAHLGLTSFFYY